MLRDGYQMGPPTRLTSSWRFPLPVDLFGQRLLLHFSFVLQLVRIGLKRDQIFDFRRAIAATQEASSGGSDNGAGSIYGAGGKGKMAARLGQQQQQQQPVAAAAAAAEKTSTQLPEGWTEMSDPSTGKAYFHNVLTNVTTWERPVPAFMPQQQNMPAQEVGGAAEVEGENSGTAYI